MKNFDLTTLCNSVFLSVTLCQFLFLCYTEDHREAQSAMRV